MGHVATITCDRPGCSSRITDSRGQEAVAMAERNDWKIERWEGSFPMLACPTCLAGQPEDVQAITIGTRRMMEGFQLFDQNADCYAVPCEDKKHSGDGCLVHIYWDDLEDMEGPYGQVISSGCGSYHAQVVSPEGEILVATDEEVWWQ